MGPHSHRPPPNIDRKPFIVDFKTAAITCAPAAIDRFAATLSCKPGMGTCKAETIDDLGPPIDRVNHADGRVAPTITCLPNTIARNAEVVDRSSLYDGLNSLLDSRMRALGTGRCRLIDGNAPLLDGTPETIDRSASHALLNDSLITRCSGTIDHNSATITHSSRAVAFNPSHADFATRCDDRTFEREKSLHLLAHQMRSCLPSA